MSRLLALGLLLAGPVTVAAQTLRGDVRALETHLPLPFSTVVVQPGVTGRFTNDSGVFAFHDLARGEYRVIVRAIGFLPFDSVITVAADTIVLHVALRALAIELPPVTVVATRACVRPGPPARDSEPDLAAIFDQLRENAARFRLLSEAYPFRYWIQRRVWDEPGAHGDSVAVDTLELRSDVQVAYKPGGLIMNQTGPKGRSERTLRLPTVIDLADSVFHQAHCFSFGGIDNIEGESQWRVDFLAADRLHAPDVAGSAWLDSTTYELRQLVFRLTRPEKAATSLKTLEVTVAFGALLPAVTVPIHIAATSEAKTRSRRAVTGHEEQRLLRVDFLQGTPGNQPP
jgi:carboxypeptidase family protein